MSLSNVAAAAADAASAQLPGPLYGMARGLLRAVSRLMGMQSTEALFCSTCCSGDMETVLQMLALHADMSGTELRSLLTSGLAGACQGDQHELVKMLLQRGADPNGVVDGGATAVLLACQLDTTTILRTLLKRGGNPNMVQSCTAMEDDSVSLEFTPLMLACQHGKLKHARLLLKYKADVNWRSPSHGTTAMMLASQNGHDKVCALLQRRGADARAEGVMMDGSKVTAFHMAPNPRTQIATVKSFCMYCGSVPEKPDTLKFCSGCRVTAYCSKECQTAHWRQPGQLDSKPHKKLCKWLKTEKAKLQQEN